MKNELWSGYYGEWKGGLFYRKAGTHNGKYGDGFVPLKRINPAYESPFDIFPIATWTLAIGVVVTFIALLYINFLY
jgi:hypothetical protein